MSKKDDILDAGLKEFGTYSYDSASINRIIASSGTSKGTFYHYFKDKRALYLAIVQKAMDLKQQYMARMMNSMSHDNADLFIVMKDQVRTLVQFSTDYPEMYKFGEMFMTETSRKRDEILGQFLPDIGDAFQKIVELGIKQGSFSMRYPPEFITKIVRYMMMNYYNILFDEGEKLTTEAIESKLDMLFDFLKRGFS